MEVELENKVDHLREIIEDSETAAQEIEKAKQNLREAKLQSKKKNLDFENEYNSIFKYLDCENRNNKINE